MYVGLNQASVMPIMPVVSVLTQKMNKTKAG